VSADLDALDRGVIETGQLAAQALSRIEALEATVRALSERLEAATRAEAILARAEAPSPEAAAYRLGMEAGKRLAGLPGRLAAGRPTPKRRCRHLKAVSPIGGQQ
jgi:hypothetical protein